MTFQDSYLSCFNLQFYPGSSRDENRRIYTDYYAVITSLNYPSGYPINYYYNYTIIQPENAKITLKWEYFWLEPFYPYCRWDFVIVSKNFQDHRKMPEHTMKR